MKKCCFYFVLMWFVSGTIYTQVNISVSVRKPAPVLLSEWENNPSVVRVVVVNSSQNEYQSAIFSVKVKDYNGKVVLQSNLNPLQPRYTIRKLGTMSFTWAQIINLDVANFDSAFKSKVTSTNMIPEGYYELCVNLLDKNGNEISSSGEVCTMFSSTIPDPPALILPAEGDSMFASIFPQFVWSPVTNVPPGLILKYRITVAPMYLGQSAKHALESNILLLDKVILTSSYQYLPSDKSFTFYADAVGFSWQVQALDQFGKPATRNEGKSEVKYFYLKKP